MSTPSLVLNAAVTCLVWESLGAVHGVYVKAQQEPASERRGQVACKPRNEETDGFSLSPKLLGLKNRIFHF